MEWIISSVQICLDQRLLALLVARLLGLLEQVLDLPMVFLKQGDGVGLFAAWHWGTSVVLRVKTAPTTRRPMGRSNQTVTPARVHY